MNSFERNRLILIWGAASILYAGIVHVLFCIQAPATWTVAKWSAGEILTYVSTVSLGLLAVWQNKRFKEENDIAQSRLENLVKQSNELSTINKIIEIEFDRYGQVIEAFNLFSKKCDPQNITTVFSDSLSDTGVIINKVECISAMVKLENEIDQSYFQVARVLRIDPSLKGSDGDPLKTTFKKYYVSSKEIVKELQLSPTSNVENKISALVTVRDAFITEREKYIHVMQDKLVQVLFGNMTLEEIKKTYANEL